MANPRLDQHEEPVVELAAAKAIPQKIQDGRIDHALVVSGLFRWLRSEASDPPQG